ncbi:MAG: EamA family transporter [Eubacterium sp.]
MKRRDASLNTLWPILIVIAANTFYNICAKEIPDNVPPFAALTITYISASIVSLILYFITNGSHHLMADVQRINWASIVLGISIVALEFGYIQVYRVGFNISMGSLIANIGLAMVLIFVGVFLYKEVLTVNQVIGVILCIGGMIFLNR